MNLDDNIMLFRGYKSATKGYISFFHDYDNAVQRQNLEFIYNLSSDVAQWFISNNFIFLIHKQTLTVHGIRFFDKLMPKPALYLFISDYIPFRMPMQSPSSQEVLTNGLKSISLYNTEIATAMEQAESVNKKVLFIYDCCGEDQYYAYSLTDEEMVIVDGINNNHEADDITGIFSDKKYNLDSYYIYIPSKEFINTIPLDLDFDVISS